MVINGADWPALAPESLRPALLQGKILTDWVLHAKRGYHEALLALDAVSALAGPLGEDEVAATALDLLGLADQFHMLQVGSGDEEAPLGRFRAALARREALGDSRGVAELLFHVGLAYERLEQYDEALDRYQRASARAKRHHHRLELSYAARRLAARALAAGNLDAAIELFGESLSLRQQLGCALLLPLAHIILGDALLARTDRDGAAREYEQAHALAAGMQSPLTTIFAFLALAELAQARDQQDARRDYAEKALSHAQEVDVPVGIRAAKARSLRLHRSLRERRDTALHLKPLAIRRCVPGGRLVGWRPPRSDATADAHGAALDSQPTSQLTRTCACVRRESWTDDGLIATTSWEERTGQHDVRVRGLPARFTPRLATPAPSSTSGLAPAPMSHMTARSSRWSPPPS
jgi:tetratricopeptide (TPR) repeat protein